MLQKYQKKFTLTEFLIVVAILLIIGSIAVPSIINSNNKYRFKESFGVEIVKSQLNDEKRQIIQPLVTKRLQELRNNLETVQREKADLLMLPETAIPEETTQRINKLNEIEAKITSTSAILKKAEDSAKHLKFQT